MDEPNHAQPQPSATPGADDAAHPGGAATPMTNQTAITLAIYQALRNASPQGRATSDYITLSRPVFEWIITRLASLDSPSLASAPASKLESAASAVDSPAVTPGDPAGFATHYHVHLRGTFAKDGERALIISTGGKTLTIPLKLVQFLTLLVLACLARREAELDAPIDVRGGAFLQPSRIFSEILKLKKRQPELADQAPTLDQPDVYQARYGIRDRLEEAALDPNLFESRPRSGYRISTRPDWIKITLFDDEGSQTWG